MVQNNKNGINVISLFSGMGTGKQALLDLNFKIELCHLQGFEDNYCEILTRNETASVCGDRWTLPMIKHFFQYLPFVKN